MTSPHRVVVVGAGITGLATAHTLLARATSPLHVTLLEASDTVGGVIRTSPFASLPAVDEGADAFLTRVPWARDLARDLGLEDDLVSPRNAGAYVWRNELHDIPHELLLGVPANMKALATTRLLSLRAKARAALEPLLPQQSTSHDCLGELIRGRFGNEVHEYLVDPLVGSIYAADTDHFSIEAVPQIQALTSERSLLLAARRTRSRTALTGPVFATPRLGMGDLVAAAHRDVVARGGSVIVSSPVSTITKNSNGTYAVVAPNSSHEADAVVLASPASVTAPLLREISPTTADMLASWSHASVAMLTLAVTREQWPSRLTGSGYLVPKPEQRWVTAASFGSNKWSHWNPDDRSMILRVSLGRDGRDVMDFDDDTLVNLALADLAHHLDAHVEPHLVRLTRWPHSFPQYRPHHFAKVHAVETALAADAPRITLAGASYRGIGVPACIQQARVTADTTREKLLSLPQ